MPSRGAGIVVAVLVGAATAVAQDAPPPRVEWLTDTGRAELAPASLVCVGAVRSVRAVRGAVVVEVEVTEVLHGSAPAGGLARVLATDPRPFTVGEDGLWLLAPDHTGGLLRARGHHVLGNPEGDERLAILRDLLRLEAMADPAARVAALRTWLLGQLGGREWARWLAIRELFVLVERVPGFLRPEDIRELETLLGSPLKRSFHQYLVSTICRAQVVPALERFATDPDPAVRGAAAAELTALPPVRRTAYLCGRLRETGDPQLRARTCELLSLLVQQDRAVADRPGPPDPRNAATRAVAEQITALRERFRDDSAASVRAAAAQALVWCDPDVGPLLLEALDHEPAPMARAAIARLCARQNLRAAVPKLRAILARTIHPEVRVSAEWALDVLLRTPVTPPPPSGPKDPDVPGSRGDDSGSGD